MNATAPKHTKAAHCRLPGALALTLLVSMLAPSWTESEIARSSSHLAPIATSNAWHCRQLRAPALDDHRAEGRRLLRAARATSLCRHFRRRYELCEPTRVRWSPSSSAAPTEEVRELSPRLCVIGDCNGSRADAARVALADGFGRRAVTATGIDRLCVELD